MTDPGTPATPARRELSLRAVLLGLLLAVVMGAANVYVGLYAGLTVSASIPAAVMAMLFFRYVYRDRSILEANQVQTCASAGESLAAGIIFTMPALVLMGTWTDFDFWTVTAVAFTGGLLGILLMIPMRKVFILQSPELPYPEGIACAAVLESGEAADDDSAKDAAQGLLLGGLLGAFFKLATSFIAVVKPAVEGVRAVGDRVAYFGSDVSPMLVAVGFIVRLNVAFLLFLGGAIGWLVIMPLLSDVGEWSGELAEYPWHLWSEEVRYVGVGAMVVGGAASIWSVRHGLVAAIQHLTAGSGERATSDDRERDLPTPVILGFSLLAVLLVAGLYYRFTGGSVPITALLTVLMLVAAFFFTAVASYIVGLVGNSNSPVSGMTITAVLFAGGVLTLVGYEGPSAAIATIGVAAVVCCVACTSGDVCNDLKTGAIVGASPFRQQMMQIAGVAVASLVMAPVLTLLNEGTEGGIGGENLSAPQASLFASLAQGFAGERELPWDLILIGAAIGTGLLVVDTLLKLSGAKFRAYVMPIAVGIYLPFTLAPPILLGGIISWFVLRAAKTDAEKDERAHRGVLFSSGVIAGEALVGVGVAAVTVLASDEINDGLASFSESLRSRTVTGDLQLYDMFTWSAIAVGLVIFVQRTWASR
ncbi:MAG: oligopeptide transporter, OPT family [Planctomycetota bacterium]